jgi:hypothetical protein
VRAPFRRAGAALLAVIRLEWLAGRPRRRSWKKNTLYTCKSSTKNRSRDIRVTSEQRWYRRAQWADAEDEPNAKYRDAHVWYDSDKKDNFTAYKLLIADVVNGRLVAVPHGIMAAGNVMQGSRGGVDLPKSDIERVKSHLAKYYKKMGEEAPWERD